MGDMRKVIATLLLSITLTGCGYDGSYRYPCQDPVNWENEECNPPVCMTTGTCTRDLIGEDAWAEYEATKGDK